MGLEIDVMIGVKNVATVKPLAETYAMEWQLRFSDEPPAVAIFVATLGRLVDLLDRWSIVNSQAVRRARALVLEMKSAILRTKPLRSGHFIRRVAVRTEVSLS
ncbi:MAG: hypothetical protein WCA59_07560 [Candidatus Binataceae bacterium]